MATTQITKHSRIDIYEENDAQRIVTAQNNRSAQSFTTDPLSISEDDDETKIYVYAFTSPKPVNIENIGGVENAKDISLIGKARFNEDFDRPEGTKYANWAPLLSGSLRLTLAKKKNA